MFQKLLDKLPLLKNWRALALCAAALLLAGFLFYLWAYGRGEAACKLGQANANQLATDIQAQANQAALGEELQDTILRVKKHTDMTRTIQDAKNPDDDDPAPALDQSFYKRLRELDR